MASEVIHRWISIPSELIGSIPRTQELVQARTQFESDLMTIEDFRKIENVAVEKTIRELDQVTGSMVLSDGEQTKPSFVTYPIYDLVFERYKFDKQCFQITFADGHVRTLPRLVKAPFKYANYAYKYLNFAKSLTNKPIKQAVITASALSMVYSPHLLNTEQGAHAVQLDFTEARLSLKVDRSGHLLKDFIKINNRVLDRFNANEQKKIGVHVCPGGDLDCAHSSDIDYTLLLPDLFQLHLTNFYIQLSSEQDRIKVLKCIQKHMKSNHRIFIGVIDPCNPIIESAETVRDRVLEAAKFIPIKQLGTTDDCGFSPFADDTSTSREVCYEKIKARIQGTKMAEQILNTHH
ncbi:unnamed protein product [Rotaria magnacalcarata]|uniref:Cobalamin-independent methionine synthase MetE C-terminal/archaeal domain-containing protein n=1 Tax=Rotaria magnacalcarata TaxID=392030 RepID=A0A819MPU7_9BILA|nr:unnamed protein product [Rotaria magnacalcarata]CAF4067712.1 unnamed protein product [Rotaria magnacalcarata]